MMVASILTDLLDFLESISSSPWFYAAIFAVAFLDSVVPVVPGETTVILGGIAAGQGELSLVLVIVVGAIGAFSGTPRRTSSVGGPVVPCNGTCCPRTNGRTGWNGPRNSWPSGAVRC